MAALEPWAEATKARVLERRIKCLPPIFNMVQRAGHVKKQLVEST
jgi:hypothetical protein